MSSAAIADVRLEDVVKRFDGATAVAGISLDVPPGSFFALLGPSGCGKTTTLRMIGGFEEPNEGRIFLGDRDVVGLPPYKRDVNTVFQSYALFPAQSALPRDTRRLRVTITSEGGGRTSNFSSVDNVSLSLTRGACEPTLAVRCTRGVLVATVTPSDIARTQRVRFQVNGAKGRKQVSDARAPYTARIPMIGSRAA